MNAIKERRLALGMTQKALAEALGVCRSTVNNWEQGICAPADALCGRLCTFFQCDAEELGLIPELPAVHPDEESKRQYINLKNTREYMNRRLTMGLSCKELAEKAGIYLNTVYFFEDGRHWPTWETRQKIRRALDMPEERCFTIEERNNLFLDMQNYIHWLIGKNMRRISAAHVDFDELFQDMAEQTLRAIDRYQPDKGTTLITFVRANLEPFMKSALVKSCMHGLSGKVCYPPPDIHVFSLDALMEAGRQQEDEADFCDDDYEESRPRW